MILGTAARAAQEVGGPNGPAVAGLQEYRDATVPQVFSPLSAAWLYVDIAILAALLGLGAWCVLTRRHSRWLATGFAIALLYFGLFRGGCLCPVGATANVALGLTSPELIGRAELVIFLLPLVLALGFGRVFCSTGCPLGAVQHLASRKTGAHLPRRVHSALLLLPVIVLGLTVTAAAAQVLFFVCRLDPYKTLFFAGHHGVQRLTLWLEGRPGDAGIWYVGDSFGWLFLVLLLVCGWVIPRVFCRYLCPYGVLLGLLSSVAFRRRTLSGRQCTECQRCVRMCPVQAITPRPGAAPSVSAYQCIQCNRCDDTCPAIRALSEQRTS